MEQAGRLALVPEPRRGPGTTMRVGCPVASRPSVAKGTRSRSTPTLTTNVIDCPSTTAWARDGCGSFILPAAAAAGQRFDAGSLDERRGRRSTLARSACSRDPIQRVRGAPFWRCGATAATTCASAATVGTSPCNIWNASRSCWPIPTSNRALPVGCIGRRPGTPRGRALLRSTHRARPRGDGAAVDGSACGTASCPAGAAELLRQGLGDRRAAARARRRARPRSANRKAAARRARVPVPSSARTMQDGRHPRALPTPTMARGRIAPAHRATPSPIVPSIAAAPSANGTVAGSSPPPSFADQRRELDGRAGDLRRDSSTIVGPR